MKNYKMIITYDGTRYYGWEHQPTTDMTIQGKLESVLSAMTGTEVEVIGAGRTDAGVHAKGMVANAHMETKMKEDEICDYMNRYLPEDICVQEVRVASDRFHSRYNAQGKTYCYTCYVGDKKPVFNRKYVNIIEGKLDVDAMKRAAMASVVILNSFIILEIISLILLFVGTNLVDEVLVGFGIVITREFHHRLLLLGSILKQYFRNVGFSLNDTVAVVDSQFAQLGEVEWSLVSFEQFRLGLAEVNTVREVVAQLSLQLIGVKSRDDLCVGEGRLFSKSRLDVQWSHSAHPSLTYEDVGLPA